MYEKLIKALREHAKPYGWDCSVCMCRDSQNRGFFTCTEELAALAADAIEELNAYAQQFEKLRKDGYYLQKTKMMTYGQAIMTMPLPEPPKEEI